MQELHGYAENVVEQITCLKSCRAVLVKQSALADLDIPVAEVVPDEIDDLGKSYAEIVIIDIDSRFSNNVMELCKDPLVFECVLRRIKAAVIDLVRHVHDDESHSVPDLVGKVSSHYDLVFLESLVVARSITGNESESQSICAVILDDLERIDSVA